MRKADLLYILLLELVVLFIFHPLFYTDFAYTDEIVQLWYYPKDPNFQMFMPQGRYVTEKLFQWLFGTANTISDIKYIRIFSLVGWMLSVPVWYYIINKIVQKENLPKLLTFFSTLYLICTPPFSIYVQWASCLELFLANTSGLIAGYILYNGIRFKNGNAKVSTKALMLPVAFGIISLFTYQTGFGCFLLPFLLHLIAHPKTIRTTFIGIGVYLLTYLVYFLLFKLSMKAIGIAASDRTSLFIAPWSKLKFLVTRPLAEAFHFTYLFNELDMAGYIIYAALFGGWILLTFIKYKAVPVLDRIKYFLIIFFIFALAYIPGLVVRENYASNRTLLALNMAVFFLTADALFYLVQKQNVRKGVVAFIAILFVINAWYNFNKLFLQPITYEYVKLKSYIETKYQPGVKQFYFIRPEEDFFVRRFGITRSWDEFGVPSSFFDWVPEFLVKEVVYEKTRNRVEAESLKVEHWLGKKDYLKSGKIPDSATILLDAETIIKQ